MAEEKIRQQVDIKDEKMPHVKTPLSYKLECLEKEGYTDEFRISEEGLKCFTSGEVFQPEDLYIVEHHRFEGITNPDDMAILYVVETKSGKKGTIIDAFGIYADTELMEFMKKVEDRSVASMGQTCGC